MFYRAADQRRRGKLILFDIASAYFFMFVIFVHIYIYSYIYIERGVRQRGGGGSLGMCGAVRARCSLATIWYITFASICIYDDLLYMMFIAKSIMLATSLRRIYINPMTYCCALCVAE